jgi:hypothetical protein
MGATWVPPDWIDPGSTRQQPRRNRQHEQARLITSSNRSEIDHPDQMIKQNRRGVC